MPRLWDEMPTDYFELQAELKARRYCDECRRKTFFTRDMDGMPVCREHDEMEVCHADEA